MSEASRYGQYYWCVKVTDALTEAEEIYVHADDVEFVDGAVLFIRGRSAEGRHINLAIPRGQWLAIYAASVLDGAPVAVEHWLGEVVGPAGGGSESV